MLLGIDFDNTIISYDALFHRVAVEKGLIPVSLLVDKNTIRNYLRKTGREEQWTRIQGEVYGSRIQEAIPFEGMFETLKMLQSNDISLVLVSHKTRRPYLGPPLDLHEAAYKWLEKEGFFDPEGLGWKNEQIFFEMTKEDKVRRICKIGCTHFIDDLPEILKMLPENITRIQFLPKSSNNNNNNWTVMKSWKEMPKLNL